MLVWVTVPSDDLQPKLAKYNVSVEEYRATFLKEDDKLTTNSITTISENHHFKNIVMVFLKECSCYYPGTRGFFFPRWGRSREDESRSGEQKKTSGTNG